MENVVMKSSDNQSAHFGYELFALVFDEAMVLPKEGAEQNPDGLCERFFATHNVRISRHLYPDAFAAVGALP